MDRAAGQLDLAGEDVQIALVKGIEQRLLVRKILVHRAHGHAGALGHPGGGQPIESLGEQNLNGRLENGIQRDQ